MIWSPLWPWDQCNMATAATAAQDAKHPKDLESGAQKWIWLNQMPDGFDYHAQRQQECSRFAPPIDDGIATSRIGQVQQVQYRGRAKGGCS